MYNVNSSFVRRLLGPKYSWIHDSTSYCVAPSKAHAISSWPRGTSRSSITRSRYCTPADTILVIECFQMLSGHRTSSCQSGKSPAKSPTSPRSPHSCSELALALDHLKIAFWLLHMRKQHQDNHGRDITETQSALPLPCRSPTRDHHSRRTQQSPPCIYLFPAKRQHSIPPSRGHDCQRHRPGTVEAALARRKGCSHDTAKLQLRFSAPRRRSDSHHRIRAVPRGFLHGQQNSCLQPSSRSRAQRSRVSEDPGGRGFA